MRTHELAKLLLEYPDMEVIMQKDEEGNGYKPLRGVDFDCMFDKETEEVFSTEWSAEDAGFEEDDWEEFKNNTPTCAVLFPGWFYNE